jgi:hypothetical protein
MHVKVSGHDVNHNIKTELFSPERGSIKPLLYICPSWSHPYTMLQRPNMTENHYGQAIMFMIYLDLFRSVIQ